MKKVLIAILAVALVLGIAACNTEHVMTYEEYAAAELDSEVTVEAYVQAHQSWWDNKITVYAVDGDGGYFFYELQCTEADAAKLVPGTKIKVKGTKAEWSGEVEISGGTFEIESGSYIAKPTDVTSLLGTEDLAKKMNQFVSFKGLKIEASKIEGEDQERAFLYKWNGAGEQGDDLYFNASVNGGTYTFVIESYLCDKDSEVYKAVEALQIGDTVDLEGFLYWYNGAQPHITSLIKK